MAGGPRYILPANKSLAVYRDALPKQFQRKSANGTVQVVFAVLIGNSRKKQSVTIPMLMGDLYVVERSTEAKHLFTDGVST